MNNLAVSLWVDTVSSPLGDIQLARTDRALVGLSFVDCPSRWWQGRSRSATLVPTVNPLGMGDRWPIFLEIIAYGTISAAGTAPNSSRAHNHLWRVSRSAGRGEGGASCGYTANAHNPVAIAIPCHRVIGKNGSLTGYTAGLERKRWLLVHEAAALATVSNILPRKAKLQNEDSR